LPAPGVSRSTIGDGATSAPVLVSVRFRVGLRVSRLHPPAGAVVHFHGHVAPAHRGLSVLVQRLVPRGRWQTVRRTRLRGAGPGFSFYTVWMRVERSGRYRVVVIRDSTHARGVSATVHIRVR